MRYDLEPDGGNFYKPHMLQIDSGTFWRCKHGRTGMKNWMEYEGCTQCALENPKAYFIFKFPNLSKLLKLKRV